MKTISDLVSMVNLTEMSHTLSRLHHQSQTAGDGITGLLALGGHRYAVCSSRTKLFDLTEGWLEKCAPAEVFEVGMRSRSASQIDFHDNFLVGLP